uniref:GCR049 n=1 Tax=Schmidtea mediterranea TaxID=79327 RepID=A0A193KUG9_SCHMD|nr:GCR049 [Schmidtea mediterranea]
MQFFQVVTNCSTNSGNFSASANIEKIYQIISITLLSINSFANCFALHIFSKFLWHMPILMNQILARFSFIELIFQMTLLLFYLVEYMKIDEYIISSRFVNPGIMDALFRCIYLFSVGFLIARNSWIILLAFHRFECICYPLRTKRYVTSANINFYFFGIVSFAILIAFPRMFEQTYTYCLQTGDVVNVSEALSNVYQYRIVYLNVFVFLIQIGIPLLSVNILSILMLRKIRQSLTFRRTSAAPNQKKKSFAADKLVVALCITFFTFEMPSFFSKLFHNSHIISNDKIIYHLTFIANISIYIDSSMNLLIYLVSNRIFRGAVLQQISKVSHKKTVSTTKYLTIAKKEEKQFISPLSENNIQMKTNDILVTEIDME